MDKLIMLRNALTEKLSLIYEENRELIELDDNHELTDEQYEKCCLIESYTIVVNDILSTIDKIQNMDI